MKRHRWPTFGALVIASVSCATGSTFTGAGGGGPGAGTTSPASSSTGGAGAGSTSTSSTGGGGSVSTTTSSSGTGGSVGTGGSSTTSSSATSSSSSTTTSSSSSTTTSSSSSTTTSSSSTTTSSSSTTTSSSSSSSGSTCPESPCQLTMPQCGCAAGEECTIQGTATVCAPAGNVPVGGACGTSADECAEGTLCIEASATVSTCKEFCSTNADCVAPGGLCAVQLDNGMGGTIPGVTLCSANCSPLNNTGCPVAGTACQLLEETMAPMSLLSDCVAVGTGTHNTPCDQTMEGGQCAAKFGCFNTGTMAAPDYVCLRYCNVALQNCPGLQLCNDLGVMFDGIEYGACD
jgi:hypothetical protein